MNRYIIELVDGVPLCTVTKSNKQTYTIEGKELIQFLGRIDESIYGRKERINPLYDKHDTGRTLFYINKLQRKNVRLRNYEELIEPLKQLYRENRRDIRREQKLQVLKAKAAAGVVVGGLALGALAATAGKHVDLEKTATYEQVEIEHEKIDNIIDSTYSTTELDAISSSINDDVEMMQTEKLTEEETMSIVSNNVKDIDVEAYYDQGINDRIDPYYNDIVERSNKRGVSPGLMYDIISQEFDGTNTNLTHVVFDSWKDMIIETHDFTNNIDERIVLTDTPEKYRGMVDQIITREDLKNPKTNISVGAIVLQFSIKYYDYNIPLGIQAYNNGVGGVDKIIETTAEVTGLTRGHLLSDMSGTDWIPYTNVIEFGDPHYFEHVVKHIDNDQTIDKVNEPYTIKYMENGEEQEETVQFRLK